MSKKLNTGDTSRRDEASSNLGAVSAPNQKGTADKASVDKPVKNNKSTNKGSKSTPDPNAGSVKGGKAPNNPVKQDPANEAKASGLKETPKVSNKKHSEPIRISREIFAWDDALLVAKKDAPKVTYGDVKSTNKYVGANLFQYYVALNTLAMIWIPEPNYSKESILRRWVINTGLLPVIADCAAFADRVIAELNQEGYNACHAWRNALDNGSLGAIFDDDIAVEDLIFRLRVLKRFTITAAPKLEDSTLESFKSCLIKTNWRKYSMSISKDPDVSTPMISRTVYGKLVKKHIGKMLKNFAKYYKEEHGSFSSGVCSDGKDLSEKIAAYSLCVPYLDNPLMGINRGIYAQHNKMCGLPETWEVLNTLERKGRAKGLFIPEVRCVPKNYKVYRTIAPESSYVSFEMQRVRRALVKCLAKNGYNKYFDVSTQDPNRIEARLSSISGYAVTVDLTSASDLIARHIALQLMPEEFVEIVTPFLPDGIKVGNKIYAPSIFLTSGNPATFMVLGIVVLACALAAVDLHNELPFTQKLRLSELIILVFGDDAVIDRRISEQFLSFIEHLGLVVNYSKTFFDHYRESCGVEYVDGFPTMVDYWPRKVVNDPRVEAEVPTLMSLISMQHRYIHNERCGAFLYELVRKLRPDMTESEIGAESVDLWSHFPVNKKVSPPYDRGKVSRAPSMDLLESMPREMHLISSSVPSKSIEKLDANGREAIEQYMYYSFLAEGPTYADKLSELLRVSEPSIGVDLAAKRPEVVLKAARK